MLLVDFDITLDDIQRFRDPSVYKNLEKAFFAFQGSILINFHLSMDHSLITSAVIRIASNPIRLLKTVY